MTLEEVKPDLTVFNVQFLKVLIELGMRLYILPVLNLIVRDRAENMNSCCNTYSSLALQRFESDLKMKEKKFGVINIKYA